MDLQKLKSAYDASRSYRGDTLTEAADKVGKSQSMIHMVLSGDATSAPTIDAVKTYIYETGLIKSEKELMSLSDSSSKLNANQQ